MPPVTMRQLRGLASPTSVTAAVRTADLWPPSHAKGTCAFKRVGWNGRLGEARKWTAPRRSAGLCRGTVGGAGLAG